MRRALCAAVFAVPLLAAVARAQEPPIPEGRPPEWGVEFGYVALPLLRDEA